MNPNYWISELGRIYIRSTEAIEQNRSDAVEPLTNDFNDALGKLKEEFPDNPIVSDAEEIRAYTDGAYGDNYMSVPQRRDEALHEVRSGCERIANAIGHDLPELDSGKQAPREMVMVSVNSQQETKQHVQQEVTVEQIQQTIQLISRPEQDKEELREILAEFESEVDGEQDENTLRRLLTEAGNISKEVMTQMAIHALKSGATGILGLL